MNLMMKTIAPRLDRKIRCSQRFGASQHSNLLVSVAFGPDGRITVSSSSDRTVKFWDISSSLCLKTIQKHSRHQATSASHMGVQKLPRQKY